MLQVLIRDSFRALPPVKPMVELCAKCGGTGKFIGYTGKVVGDCFTCNGAGKLRIRPQAEASGSVVNDDELRAAFERAAIGMKRTPRITLGDIVVKPAPAHSKNAGALYVTESSSGTYLGKILGGRFQCTRECDPARVQRITELVSDPKGAIEAYGKETGICAICNAELTDPESIERGIGPICAGRFGF